MRTWSIILGAIIFLCVVCVSFSHTVELYQRVGFALWEAIVFTIAVETTFFLSAWTIMWRRNKGENPSGSAYAGFAYGVILVFFSNSAYTVGLDILFENKIAQWVLALSVVFGVLVSESIISQNLAELHRAGDSNLQLDGGWSLQDKEKMEAGEKEMEKSSTSTPSTTMGVETNTSPFALSTPSDNLYTLAASNPSTLSTISTTAAEKKVEKAKRKVEHHQKAGKNGLHQEMVENRHPSVEQEKKRSSTSNVESVALEIYKQEGRLPGRKRLMEEAGVSEWEARKTLQELRKKVG